MLTVWLACIYLYNEGNINKSVIKYPMAIDENGNTTKKFMNSLFRFFLCILSNRILVKRITPPV